MQRSRPQHGTGDIAEQSASPNEQLGVQPAEKMVRAAAGVDATFATGTRRRAGPSGELRQGRALARAAVAPGCVALKDRCRVSARLVAPAASPDVDQSVLAVRGGVARR